MTFGDFDADDALDVEPPAPEQVAYRLHHLRAELDVLTGAPAMGWDELTPAEQGLALAIGDSVVEHLMTHADPDTPEDSARSLHAVRRFLNPRLPAWDDLDDDERALAVDLMALVLGWLRRQGAIA